MSEEVENALEDSIDYLRTFKDNKSRIDFKVPEDFRIDENGAIYKNTKDGLLRISPHFIGITRNYTQLG